MLLILAAVAINLTIGNNGIFTRAQNATQKWEEASKNEQSEMDSIGSYIENFGNSEIKRAIESGKFFDEGNTKLKDDLSNEVTIPKGFKVAKDSATKVEDGIVIEDHEGNQFVWIPVENMREFKLYTGYMNGNIDTEYTPKGSEPSNEGYRYPNELEEYNSMKTSVEKNKGFYVARFEAGNENGKVVSKKGATVWNNIPWGTSMTEVGTDGAVAKAKGMYTDKEVYDVTSTLIYGTQWDAIMLWIDPEYKKEDGKCNSFIANSIGKGNYTGEIATCGASEQYKVKNIYDLAGNVNEWTMEAFLNDRRVSRGGQYTGTGLTNPASIRWNNYTWIQGNEKRFSCCYIFIIG